MRRIAIVCFSLLVFLVAGCNSTSEVVAADEWTALNDEVRLKQSIDEDNSQRLAMEFDTADAARKFLQDHRGLTQLSTSDGHEVKNIDRTLELLEELEALGAFEESIVQQGSGSLELLDCTDHSVRVDASAGGAFFAIADAEASASGCGTSSNFAYAAAETESESESDSDNATGSSTASANASASGGDKNDCYAGASASTSVGPSRTDSDVC